MKINYLFSVNMLFNFHNCKFLYRHQFKIVNISNCTRSKLKETSFQFQRTVVIRKRMTKMIQVRFYVVFIHLSLNQYLINVICMWLKSKLCFDYM